MNRRIGFWVAFVVVHAGISWICLGLPGTGFGELSVGLPLGDVTLVYRPWIEQALAGGPIVGISQSWVYPIGAIVPMLAAMGLGPELYGPVWLALVSLLDAAAFAMLLGARLSRRPELAAWWWLAFLALLGPIALARIDAVTVPIAIVALLLLGRHPTIAGVLLAVATWMKVWPAALIAALLVASKDRTRILAAGAATSAVVGVVVFAAGGADHLFGFVTEQTGRGLQIESPAAVPYLWFASAGLSDSAVYYDRAILTFQVAGHGVDLVAALLTPLLAVAVAGTVFAGVVATRRGASVVRLLPSLALALVLVFIVVNKVGSPQFQAWLAAPVVLGLLYRGRRFAWPAGVVLALAALTQVIYPYLYSSLLSVSPAMVFAVTVRNAGLLCLLAWALLDVWLAGRQSSPSAFSSRSTFAVSSPE